MSTTPSIAKLSRSRSAKSTRKVVSRYFSPPKSTPLPEYLCGGLRLVLVGINPGAKSAHHGHHYAGPGNLFWPLLFESGLVDERLTFEDDHTLPQRYGIGLCNVVDRMTRSAAELSRKEMRTSGAALFRRLSALRPPPRVVCFVGMGAFAAATASPMPKPGVQPRGCAPGLPPSTTVFVMPSTSGRVAAYSREQRLDLFRQVADLVKAGDKG